MTKTKLHIDPFERQRAAYRLQATRDTTNITDTITVADLLKRVVARHGHVRLDRFTAAQLEQIIAGFTGRPQGPRPVA